MVARIHLPGAPRQMVQGKTDRSANRTQARGTASIKFASENAAHDTLKRPGGDFAPTVVGLGWWKRSADRRSCSVHSRRTIPRFPKYPPLPVRNCSGHVALDRRDRCDRRRPICRRVAAPYDWRIRHAPPDVPPMTSLAPRWLQTVSELALRAIVVAAFLILLGLAMDRLRLIFLPLLAAIILASALLPAKHVLIRRGLGNAVSAVAVVFVGLGLLGLIGYFTVTTLTSEFGQLEGRHRSRLHRGRRSRSATGWACRPSKRTKRSTTSWPASAATPARLPAVCSQALLVAVRDSSPGRSCWSCCCS